MVYFSPQPANCKPISHHKTEHLCSTVALDNSCSICTRGLFIRSPLPLYQFADNGIKTIPFTGPPSHHGPSIPLLLSVLICLDCHYCRASCQRNNCQEETMGWTPVANRGSPAVVGSGPLGVLISAWLFVFRCIFQFIFLFLDKN